MLLAVVVVGVPVAAVALFFSAIVGSPGSCDSAGRQAPDTPALAASFQQKWDQFNVELAAGDPSGTVVFDEGETTSRARLWLEDHDAPISDLVICFGEATAGASGKVSLPFVPGDVDILVRGRMAMTGENPEADVQEIEVGGLPGPFTDLVEAFVTDLIEDQTSQLDLARGYDVSFAAGEATITGRP